MGKDFVGRSGKEGPFNGAFAGMLGGNVSHLGLEEDL